MAIILSIIILIWLTVVTVQLVAIRRYITDAQEIKERGVPNGVTDNQNVPRTRVDS